MFASLADRLFAWPKKRGARWVVLALTVLTMGLAGPLIGQFEDSQRNDQLDFLPDNSQSVKVAAAQKELGDKGILAVVVVKDKDLKKEKAKINKTIAALAKAGYKPATPLIVAKDKQTAIFSSEITIGQERDTKGLTEQIDRYKTLVQNDLSPTVSVVAVTGPAGGLLDALNVFSSINSTLLLATGLLVFVLLLLIYRSPFFWILPLLSVIIAEGLARAAGTLVAEAGLTISGQAAGIMSVLVFGAGTDYALLLVARYREELHRIESVPAAVAVALRQTAPTIIASAGTVIAGLACLSLASVQATAGLGPAGALGVLAAALSALVVLPALLLVGGRKAFWPFVPRYGGKGADSGPWMRIARRLEKRPRPYWISSLFVLLVLAGGLAFLNNDLTSAESFRSETESQKGQKVLAAAFPAGSARPADILVTPAGDPRAVAAYLKSDNAVAAVIPGPSGKPGSLLSATLTAPPGTEAGYRQVEELRERLKARFADNVLVGGSTAEEADLRRATAADNRLLIPVIVGVVFIILVLLLQSLLLPALLMGTVLLSFAASLGVTAVVFSGAPGLSPSLPLYAFVFLVALGVDYNIFLAARTREERLSGKSTNQSMRTSLAVTGAVITSAGIVLAGTFSILGILPLWDLTEIGFAVAFGVLLDTFLVRSILVPALTFQIGDKVWWPSRLARSTAAPDGLADEQGPGDGHN